MCVIGKAVINIATVARYINSFKLLMSSYLINSRVQYFNEDLMSLSLSLFVSICCLLICLSVY